MTKEGFRSPLELLRKKERDKEEVSKFKRLQMEKDAGTIINRGGTRFLRSFKSLRDRPIVTQRAIRTGRTRGTFKRGNRLGRGRPKGSYDPRYAAYGGVYGYRKVLNAQLRERRLAALRRATINPQQQTILNQIEARERARQINPENRVIPDTRGTVRMSSINDEIDDAANLVP